MSDAGHLGCCGGKRKASKAGTRLFTKGMKTAGGQPRKSLRKAMGPMLVRAVLDDLKKG